MSALFRGAYVALIRDIEAPLAARLRRRLYATTCHIDTGVVITTPTHFTADAGCALYHATYILNTNGRLTLGTGSHLGAFCYVNAHYGTVSIGDHVAIGPGTRIVAYSNHYARGALVTDERITGDIRIGRNVFVGANCVILPGTTIADNVIIAAGSVVKGDIVDEGIYGGAPAKLIRGSWYP